MEKLTPQQALKILESATEHVQLGRKDHLLVINALKVLDDLVEEVLSIKNQQALDEEQKALNSKIEIK